MHWPSDRTLLWIVGILIGLSIVLQTIGLIGKIVTGTL